MKLTNLIIFFVILNWGKIISQPIDTAKCYFIFPFSPNYDTLTFEKKWETGLITIPYVIPIIADIDNNGKTEILIPKVHSLRDYSDTLLVLDGANGDIIRKIAVPFIYVPINPISICDIDNDGMFEIYIIAANNNANPLNLRRKIICLSMDGTIRWISNKSLDLHNQLSIVTSGSISFADFNQDGIPELYVLNEIFNANTGIFLSKGGNNGLGIRKQNGNNFGHGKAVACNLDDDPQLELAAGYTVYKINISNPNSEIGNTMTPMNIDFGGHFIDGFTAIADLNLDGKLDVIVAPEGFEILSTNNKVGLYAYNIENNQPKLLANISNWNGGAQQFLPAQPTVFFNQKENRIEILVVVALQDRTYLMNYSINNTLGFDNNWSLGIDETSAAIGVGVFDLNNDKNYEIFFRDENSFKIISTVNNIPNILYQADCASGTSFELPIIANTGDLGQAKICVICSEKSTDPIGKLTVFGAPEGQRWAPARNIWHQYAYNPLFINDDGTVPQFQENHATYKNGKYNNFMVQESLIDEDGNVPVPAASLHGEMYCADYLVDSDEVTVYFNIFNKENASLAAAINTPVSFYDGNPENGGVLLTTYYTTQDIDAGENVSSLSVTLPASITGPIWMVINTDRSNPILSDSSQYVMPECDYTDNVFVLYDLPVIDKITVEICEGDVYDFMGQMLTTTGQYIIEAQYQNGCDSAIYILYLTATNVKTSEEDITHCDTYTWNATTYTQSGTYTYQTTSSNGCDSIATLHLTIHNASESEENINACDTYFWNGNTYTDSGTYTYQSINAVGCDSTATLLLNISPSYADTTFVTTCDVYSWNGNTYTSDGIYSLQAQSTQGCDSTSTLVLKIQNTIETEENVTACDQCDWNGNTFTQSGVYTYQTTSSSGCDSIVTLYLEVFPNVTTQENISACDSLIWQNQVLTTSGMYTHQEMTLQGCDSTKQLFLTILPSTTSQSQIQACESYDWNGQTYTSSGLYTYQTNNHVGCDSTAFLELTIHPNVSETITVSACETYQWNGETYTQSGIYSLTQANQYGCDSTTNLQLTIHPSYESSLSLSACTEVEYQNNTYTTSGMYQVRLQSVFGCDSIINLTVNINAQSFEESQNVCDSFYWPQSQQQYILSGIYQEVFTNLMGCDSSYQLTLEILPSYHQTEAREVCETFTWPTNHETYTQSGLYTVQRQTQQGCDSIQILDLTIYEGFRKRDTVIADSSYTWPVNGTTYESSGTYEAGYTNIEGCDSIHYLVLRIESTYTIQFPNIINGGTNVHPFKGYSSHDNVIIKELSIYDRMASRVYHIENTRINDPNYGWNGTFRDMEVVPGVYVWMAEVVLPDGSTIQMAGDVTVIR